MGITKTQLLNSVQQVKDYVDTEISGIDATGETTYTDAEITAAVSAILNPAETQNS